MGSKTEKDEVDVIVFPFPIQGHINPMLQFSKQLATRGLTVTLVTTSAFSSKLAEFRSSSITIETISDGTSETANPGNVDSYLEIFNSVAPHTLAQLIEKKIQLGYSLKCLIYDSSMPWGLDIARKFGMFGASFFTQSCLVSSIFYQVHEGMLSAPIQEEGICVSGMPYIAATDLPSFVYAVGLYPSLERLVLDQFSNCGDADWQFFNTFDVLETKRRETIDQDPKNLLLTIALIKTMEGVANEKPSRGAHVLIFPSPVQGHINPMLQFSKRLVTKGLKVTIITTTSVSFQLSSQTTNSFELEYVTISDGFQEGERAVDLEAYLERLRASICQSLPKLLDYYKQNNNTNCNLSPTPKMVIYDSFMPWVLDVVRKCGFEGSPFLTQSCMVNSIYYFVYEGALEVPMSGSLVSLPSIKGLLRFDDMPSFVSSPGIYLPILRLALDIFSNFKEAKFLFVNSLDKLEIEVVNWMASQWSVKTIGPAIPSMYLDKRLPNDKDYGLSLFKPETDTCIEWLDAKENGSVVYISMGSMASLGEEQMLEMAMGLEKCNKYFLWVVRASEDNKLPLSFKEKTSEKGIIVNWCPQMEVLAHRALGCFVTHCGWNSTLEAISLGVPMVAFPQWTDQPTNAKCITDFWRIGVRVKVNEKGIVTKEQIESCIRDVMEGERGTEIKSNASKWKQIAKEAMEEGGSSDRNIEEFVAKLLDS